MACSRLKWMCGGNDGFGSNHEDREQMKTMRPALILATVVVAVCAGNRVGFGQSASLGLTVTPEGTLSYNGKPYQGVGTNYFSAFDRCLKKSSNTTYVQGLQGLADHGIPFVRFDLSGFAPNQLRLYQDDKAEFFRRLDGVIRAAEQSSVGMIPSFFWNTYTVPDLVGESCNQWGNAKSKTRQFMRRFTTDVVTRYKGSPVIWGWEFGNEWNLAVDLPNAAQHLPTINPSSGTPSSRTAADILTTDVVRPAMIEFAKTVRAQDPHRVIESGNSVTRSSAWHQYHKGTWDADTPKQKAEMTLLHNPDPMNMLSIHAYYDKGKPPAIRDYLDMAARSKKPLFVGEFGLPGNTDETRDSFGKLLATVKSAPLSAVWVYDRADKDSFNITATNDRRWMLEAIGESTTRAVMPTHAPGEEPL